jgi:hypothetical protein
MTPRRVPTVGVGTIATRERRTQEARIAALFAHAAKARPRTCYRAGQRVLAAGASFFSSLPKEGACLVPLTR